MERLSPNRLKIVPKVSPERTVTSASHVRREEVSGLLRFCFRETGEISDCSAGGEACGISGAAGWGGGCRDTGVADAWVSPGLGTRDRRPANRQRGANTANACRQLGLRELMARKNNRENMPKQANVRKDGRNSTELIVFSQPSEILNFERWPKLRQAGSAGVQCARQSCFPEVHFIMNESRASHADLSLDRFVDRAPYLMQTLHFQNYPPVLLHL